MPLLRLSCYHICITCLAITKIWRWPRYNEGVKRVFKITPKDILAIRENVADMTQKEFAQALGVSTPTITRIECETLLPSLRLLFKIAERFDVTFEITPEKLHPLLAEKNGAGD